MANKQTLLTCFNNKFDEFLRDLVTTFPEDKDFKLFKNSFSLLKTVDPKQPQAIFHMYAPMYKQKIIERDEKFFLNNDYDELKSMDLQAVKTDVVFEVISKLKGYWLQLDDTNRDIIWQYLNLLIVLDEKCSKA